jgi:LmbE family N-acetylglucosaminyl deacetylase
MADPLTLMAVHAHPDDESSSTGGVLALASEQGIRTVVVTCTNGELGDAPGGIKPGQPGHDETAVAALRLAELDKACAVLGVTAVEKLGYHDSGMPDWEYRSRTDVFCNVPVEESAGRVVALMEQYRPDVVVTYNEFGGYEHPDHIQASRIARLAIDRTAIPAKLYFTAFRWSGMQRLRTRMAELGLEVGPPPQIGEDLVRKMGPRQPAGRVVVRIHAARALCRVLRRGDVHTRRRPHRRAPTGDRPVRRPALIAPE